ncbi:TolC family protein [Alteromonas sp. CYL-A6]|uniref:TolC family protein n=1 Tax=Alteromonas nitratireducens TaxID=3390813 RepID=UPI0034BDA60C
MNSFLRFGLFAWLILPAVTLQAQTQPLSSTALSLDDAIEQAVQADPWFSGSQLREDAALARVNAANALPDPMVSVSMANLPTDSFSFAQEPMTQIKVGVSQTLPRGESRALMQDRHNKDAARYPLMREDRRAQVGLTVTQRWLDYLEKEAVVGLIKQDLGLFDQLIEIAESAYASGVGSARQQDVFNAQLERSALEDRLARVEGQRREAIAALAELMDVPVLTPAQLNQALPDISLPAWLLQDAPASRQQLYTSLQQHPRVRQVSAQREVAETDAELARQAYAPQWTLNSSYGYRQDDEMGRSRADFLSVGVTFSVPFVNQDANDSAVSAAVASAGAIETEKRVMIREFAGRVSTLLQRFAALTEREALYADTLISQSQNYAEAALNAYTSDTGTFETVTEARIRHLNNRIAHTTLMVDALRTKAQLRYFLTATESQGDRND